MILKGEGDTADFWVIIAAMALLLFGMLAYFRKRGWL